MKPLFIPLKREFYDAFADRSKDTEYRVYGPRWNERTCPVGREVVLSRGYGKSHRLRGTVAAFQAGDVPLEIVDDWMACYGPNFQKCAMIRIAVQPGEKP